MEARNLEIKARLRAHLQTSTVLKKFRNKGLYIVKLQLKKTKSIQSKSQSNIIKAINEAIEEFVASMEGKVISNI